MSKSYYSNTNSSLENTINGSFQVQELNIKKGFLCDEMLSFVEEAVNSGISTFYDGKEFLYYKVGEYPKEFQKGRFEDFLGYSVVKLKKSMNTIVEMSDIPGIIVLNTNYRRFSEESSKIIDFVLSKEIGNKSPFINEILKPEPFDYKTAGFEQAPKIRVQELLENEERDYLGVLEEALKRDGISLNKFKEKISFYYEEEELLPSDEVTKNGSKKIPEIKTINYSYSLNPGQENNDEEIQRVKSNARLTVETYLKSLETIEELLKIEGFETLMMDEEVIDKISARFGEALRRAFSFSMISPLF